MAETLEKSEQTGKRVGLFATCLIDLFRPKAGFAAVKLLEEAGYEVAVPEQGCCGQPNFNGGDSVGARDLALATINTFATFDYVIVPSCSCAAMIRVHYPELFEANSSNQSAAQKLADKTWELTSFLHEVAGVSNLDARYDGKVVVHDACAGLRELGVRNQPRALLNQISGVIEQPLENPDVCCGFGGTFCVKYPDVSNRIAEKKLDDIRAVEPDMLVSTDLGCLMHLSGKLHREGSAIRVLHIAELLAGMTDGDAEGGGDAG